MPLVSRRGWEGEGVWGQHTGASCGVGEEDSIQNQNPETIRIKGSMAEAFGDGKRGLLCSLPSDTQRALYPNHWRSLSSGVDREGGLGRGSDQHKSICAWALGPWALPS